jgi:hypothetical protein
MSVNVYEVGDKPRLTATYTLLGIATDPDAGALIIKHPDGSLKSYLTSGGFSDQGNWDANANSPELTNDTGDVGDYYTVTVAGSVNFGDGAISFAVNDYVVYDGESWVRLPSPQSATLTKDSDGIFYYDFPLHQEGRYKIRSEGYGNVHAATESHLEARKSAIR